MAEPMLARPLPIRAAGGIAFAAAEAPADVRAALKAVCPQAPRRLSRFIELNLAGALRAVAAQPLPATTPIWLATGQGYVASTATLLRGLQRDGEAPMPVHFINVSGNAAGFYLAQLLGLSGPALALSSRPFAFESALELAARELLLTGGVGLVGGVDECAWPLAEHRERLGVPAGRPLGEGSHWLLLGGDAAAPVLGELLAVGVAGRGELAGLALPADCRLAHGWGVAPERAAALARELGIESAPVAPTGGYRETYAAGVVADFLAKRTGGGGALLYLDAADERWSLLLVRRRA